MRVWHFLHAAQMNNSALIFRRGHELNIQYSPQTAVSVCRAPTVCLVVSALDEFGCAVHGLSDHYVILGGQAEHSHEDDPPGLLSLSPCPSLILSIAFKLFTSVGGVSEGALIPVLLFILPVTLIPSGPDPETSLIPRWQCTRGPQLMNPMLCCFLPG